MVVIPNSVLRPLRVKHKEIDKLCHVVGLTVISTFTLTTQIHLPVTSAVLINLHPLNFKLLIGKG
jgi:hypothetical protein